MLYLLSYASVPQHRDVFILPELGVSPDGDFGDSMLPCWAVALINTFALMDNFPPYQAAEICRELAGLHTKPAFSRHALKSTATVHAPTLLEASTTGLYVVEPEPV